MRKYTNDLNRHLTKDKREAQKYMKRHSTLLVIKEMPMKTAESYQHALTGTARMKETIRWWWGCGGAGPLRWWGWKTSQPLWKSSWQFLKTQTYTYCMFGLGIYSVNWKHLSQRLIYKCSQWLWLIKPKTRSNPNAHHRMSGYTKGSMPTQWNTSAMKHTRSWHTTTRMNFKTILPSEGSQTQKRVILYPSIYTKI